MARVKYVFRFALLPPCRQFTRLLVRPAPSHAKQPEEEDDGHEQEEGVLPVVIAVVEVTVSLGFTCILV